MTEERSGGIRTAVLGTGYAVRVAAPLFRAHPAFRLTAVVGRTAARTRTRLAANGLPLDLASTMVDVVGRDDLDLVHVATPNAAHEDHVRQLLEHPAALLVEKPLSLRDRRQQELAEVLRRRRAPTLVNLPLRAVALAAPVATAGPALAVSVQLSSPFAHRYAHTDTWKTIDAEGGGIRHILLPHVCDHVLQLVRLAGDRVERIDVTVDPAAPIGSEQLDVWCTDRGRSPKLAATTRHLGRSDTFVALFARSLDSIADAVRCGGRDRHGARGSPPLADVDDLLRAYRLISRFEQQPPRRHGHRHTWHLDRDDVAEMSTWFTTSQLPSDRYLQTTGSSDE